MNYSQMTELDKDLAKLKSMLQEIGRPDFKFMDFKLRVSIMQSVIQVFKSNAVCLEHIIMSGYKGIGSMTDLDLIQEYLNFYMEDDDDMFNPGNSELNQEDSDELEFDLVQSVLNAKHHLIDCALLNLELKESR